MKKFRLRDSVRDGQSLGSGFENAGKNEVAGGEAHPLFPEGNGAPSRSLFQLFKSAPGSTLLPSAPIREIGLIQFDAR